MRVNGEGSGRTKVIYVINEGKGAANNRLIKTININWGKANIAKLMWLLSIENRY